MIIIVLAFIRITRISLVGVLFGASIICYLIMKIENKTINELNEEIKEKYNIND
jgi:Na+/melibiose symporter-like transporter